MLYGPYIVDGVPTAPSNLAFDADLRARDPTWGLRRLADVEGEAQGGCAAAGSSAGILAAALGLLVFIRRRK